MVTLQQVRQAVRANRPVAQYRSKPAALALSPPEGWKFLTYRDRNGIDNAVIAVPTTGPSAKFWREAKRAYISELLGGDMDFAKAYVNLSRSGIPFIWYDGVIRATAALVEKYELDVLYELAGKDVVERLHNQLNDLQLEEACSALELARLYKSKSKQG